MARPGARRMALQQSSSGRTGGLRDTAAGSPSTGGGPGRASEGPGSGRFHHSD